MKSNFHCAFRSWAVNGIIAVSGFMIAGYSQPACDSMAFRAERYFARGDTFAGVTEYLRFIFFCRDSSRMYETSLEAAEKLAAGGAFSSAAQWYGRASDYAPDSVKSECRLGQVIMLMQAGEYSNAQYRLSFIDTSQTIEKVKKKYCLCKAVLFSYNDEWERAQPCLERYVAGCPTGERFLEQWFGKKKGPRKKNISLAKIMHLFVPGSGHVYAGDYGGAVNSLVLCGVTGIPGYLSIRAGAWIDASLYFWLFSRFYFGGLNVVAEKVTSKNKRIRKEYCRDLDTMLYSMESECANGP